MEDELRLRTVRVLTDYLEYCARRPGTALRRPSTPEAALMRSMASQVQQRYQFSWSHYRRNVTNRVRLVAQMMQGLFHGGSINWGRVVVLVAFAGFVLERPPPGHTQALEEWEASVDQDLQSLVTLLCAALTGRHGSWLEAQGGWDGFCRCAPARLSWSGLLAGVLLSCLTLSIISILTYLCIKLL